MKKQKAFTLIEVLLATAIFATILVMTTAVVGQSSTYRTKLIEERKAGEAVRSAADFISTDLRTKTVSGDLISDFTTYHFKSGIAQLYCSNTEARYPGDPALENGGCVVINNHEPYAAGEISLNNGGDPYLNIATSDPRDPHPYAYEKIVANSSWPANTLIIFLPENKAKIYWSSRDIKLSDGVPADHILAKWAYSLYYKEVDLSYFPGGLVIGKWGNINWINDDDDHGINTANRITQFTDGEIGIIFGGYCPDDAYLALHPTETQQPYVRFFVGAKSLLSKTDPITHAVTWTGYGYLPATARGIAEIESMVTLRKYSE